jgi:glyoxylate/hydroxypyruvate reductase
MRIHIQNQIGEIIPGIDLALWNRAAARAGAPDDMHVISIGDGEAELTSGLREAEALITTSGVLVANLPLHAPRLKLVFLMNAGVDMLVGADLPEDIVILNNSGAHSDKAGEYGMMAVLMLANLVPQFMEQQKREVWSRRLAPVLSGRRATVVGLGSLGGGVAKRLRWFGMQVTGVRTRAEPHPDCDRVISTSDLDAVLPDTEFLLLTCPLTSRTRNLLNSQRISLLPFGAGVVNIGRGELIEQDALLDALDSGHLSGAILDVFIPEPVPQGHRLWRTPNLIMTPHMSAADPATYHSLSLDIFFENLRAWREGSSPPNRVNLQRGY